MKGLVMGLFFAKLFLEDLVKTLLNPTSTDAISNE